VAAGLPGMLSLKERKARAVEVRTVIAETALRYHQGQIGKTGNVLWESAEKIGDGYELQGLSEKFVRVAAISTTELWNVISKVKFTEAKNDGLSGEFLPN
jgi:tRNA A37 methylthiotransferase MiaB